jgi:hypothetical protein
VEHCLQIDQQAAEIEQTAVGLQVHEKINVAKRIVFAACHGAEDTDVSRPSSGRNTKDLVAFGSPEFLQSQGTSILSLNQRRRTNCSDGMLLSRPFPADHNARPREPTRRS